MRFQQLVRACITGATFLGTLLMLQAAVAMSQGLSKDLGSQPLVEALEAFANDTGFQIVYRAEIAAGLDSKGARAGLSAEETLRELLRETGLSFEFLNERTVAIRPASNLSSDARTHLKNSLPMDLSTGGDVLTLAQSTESGAADAASANSTEEDREASASQELPGPHETGKGIPEILVDGSKILNVDVKRSEDDAQPYHILDSKMIEQSGATSIEGFLKQRLTMNTTFRSLSQQVDQLGNTSEINLRGLGANETLILINGRRSANVTFQGTSFQPDINGIPMAAIERIEVLPASASAIYGGAALGGVVNIILKQNYEGGEFEYSYENLTGADAPLYNVDGMYGFSLEGGKTQIMLSAHYSDGEAFLLEDRRNLVDRGISTILGNSPSFLYAPDNPFPGATPNIAAAGGDYVVVPEGTPGAIGPFDGLFYLFVQPQLTLKDGSTPLNASITSIPSGTAPGSDLSAGLLSNAGTYNLNLAPGTGRYALQSPFGVVPRVKSLRAAVRREFTSSLEAFTEFSISSNATRTTSNLFTTSWTVPASAPTNPFEQDVIVQFPSALSSPLSTDSETRSVTVGLLARLPGQWASELDYTWSRNTLETHHFSGTYSETSTAFADGTLNPFVDTIAYPLDLAPYLTPSTYAPGPTTLNDLALRASGPVGSFPWGRPMLTVGLQHRKEGSHHSEYFSPASNTHRIDFGQSQSIDSVYAEALVPLVTAKNAMPLLRSLELQLAGRSERYTVDANPGYAYVSPPEYVPFNPPDVHATIKYTSTNPTLGLKYQPVEDVTFRASYAEGFLPPTAYQLLPPHPSQACDSCSLITDPQNGQTYYVSAVAGGDPDLKPQTSENWNLGVIWQPSVAGLEGLRMNLEYYKITQPNYITNPSVQEVVSNPEFASRVTRDPNSGLITLVDFSVLNATLYKTAGYDLRLDYSKPTAMGTFGFQAVGTLIEHDRRQYSINSPLLDYVDYPGEGGVGQTKANATLSWEYGGWALAWTSTYYGSYRQNFSPGSPNAIRYGADTYFTDAQGGDTIPSQMYHDLFASYTFDETSGGAGNLLSNLTVEVGVKNLFNTLPPFDAIFGPYYYSPYGDARLRNYRLVVRKSF